MRLLSGEESWDLLREKVIGEESRPFKLERFGKKIAEKCDGLPLTLITVAAILLKAEKSVEFWNEVATQEKHRVFVAVYDEVSKGVFPQNDEIPSSKVMNMWIAEGLILEQNRAKSLKKNAKKCLDELASSNVMVYKKSTKSSSRMSIAHTGIKVCGLHSSWWHLCYKEARKNNLFHVLNNLEDSLAESMKGQNRLSFHNSILLCIKDVYDAMEVWDIKELKHVQIMGSDLPNSLGGSLQNLSTLLDVSDRSCTRSVFERVGNLEKLGIRIELPPGQPDEHLRCFEHISILEHLKSLKCVVVNPELQSELVPPPILSIFPLGLKKLALSGMGYPWSEMSRIGASLAKLQVLKLRCNAFKVPSGKSRRTRSQPSSTF